MVDIGRSVVKRGQLIRYFRHCRPADTDDIEIQAQLAVGKFHPSDFRSEFGLD
jgi:hypothetical protein